MKTTSLLAAAALGTCAFTAAADLSTSYRLAAGSAMTEELTCLPPCMCEYHRWTGPLSGSFVLTRAVQGPLYDEYSVSDVSFAAVLNGQQVQLVGSGTYTVGGDLAQQQRLVLDLLVDGALQHYDSGMVFVDPQMPFPQISISAEGLVGCGQNTLMVRASSGGAACYANCDASTTPPVLNVNDFVCFLTMFAAGEPYANCDGSSTEPRLNVNDFICYLNVFAAGCSGTQL
jgi:hypothetical protein